MVQVFSLKPWVLGKQLLGRWMVWLYRVVVMPIRTQNAGQEEGVGFVAAGTNDLAEIYLSVYSL
jgi:hypothetical protein